MPRRNSVLASGYAPGPGLRPFSGLSDDFHKRVRDQTRGEAQIRRTDLRRGTAVASHRGGEAVWNLAKKTRS